MKWPNGWGTPSGRSNGPWTIQSHGSIWVLGLGTDPKNRLIRHVDDGSVTGTHASVLEPEPFVGKNEAYVYYNYFDRAGGKTGLRRAATGIKVPDSTSETTVEISTEPDEKKSIALFQRAELAGLTDSAVAGERLCHR